MIYIKNIIFDLDGTLWDSREQVLLAWKKILPINVSKKIDVKCLNSLMGKTNEEYVKFLFPKYNFNIATNLMKKCEQQEVIFLNSNGANIYNNTINTIISLSKNYNLFIVSNCQKGYIESFLNYYNLNSYFQDIECNGNTNLKKSANINLIIERNKLSRQNTCYIGDTNDDYCAAITNNLRFIYAKYGFGTCEQATYILNDISELLNLFGTNDTDQ